MTTISTNAPTNTSSNSLPDTEWHTGQMPIDADWLAVLRHLENRSAAKPVGEFFPPSQEALALHADIGLVFPATAVTQCDVTRFDSAKPGNGRARPSITSPLLGLSGPLAALPFHYTEALLVARRCRNPAAADFFDIFNHRTQSLLYRALRKHRFVLDKERALAHNSNDRYSLLLAALCGHPAPQSVGDIARLALPGDAWASFAGLFACRIRSARNLQQLLRHYFQLNITIEQFAGRWVNIDNDSRCRLSARGSVRQSTVHPPNGPQPLGVGTLLGRRSWQAAAFFSITVRNPDMAQLAQLAAGQAMRTALWSVVRAFVGDEYGFHVDIVTNNNVQCTARLHHNLHGNPHDTPHQTLHETSATRLGWLGVLGAMSPTQTATIRINQPTAARMQR